MATHVTAKYKSSLIEETIAGWGRVLRYTKSTFSRWHRKYKSDGMTSREFIELMISRKMSSNECTK